MSRFIPWLGQLVLSLKSETQGEKVHIIHPLLLIKLMAVSISAFLSTQNFSHLDFGSRRVGGHCLEGF